MMNAEDRAVDTKFKQLFVYRLSVGSIGIN